MLGANLFSENTDLSHLIAIKNLIKASNAQHVFFEIEAKVMAGLGIFFQLREHCIVAYFL